MVRCQNNYIKMLVQYCRNVIRIKLHILKKHIELIAHSFKNIKAQIALEIIAENNNMLYTDSILLLLYIINLCVILIIKKSVCKGVHLWSTSWS